MIDIDCSIFVSLFLCVSLVPSRFQFLFALIVHFHGNCHRIWYDGLFWFSVCASTENARPIQVNANNSMNAVMRSQNPYKQFTQRTEDHLDSFDERNQRCARKHSHCAVNKPDTHSHKQKTSHGTYIDDGIDGTMKSHKWMNSIAGNMNCQLNYENRRCCTLRLNVWFMNIY